MSYEDKTLKCKICGADFVFTSGEQEFYAQKGLTNEPQRCPECRSKKHRNGEKKFYEVTCAECGCTTTVPFKPTGVKPVLCRDCYEKTLK